MELGVEGYGIYFMILEVLREQPEFRYPIQDIDLLADEFRTSEQKVEVVVKKYDLFQIDADDMFYSPRFDEYLQPYLEAKERKKVGGIKGNLIKYKHLTKDEVNAMTDEEIVAFNERIRQSLATDSLPTRIASQIKRNESKGNESKVECAPSEKSESEIESERIAKHLLESICQYDPTHKYNRNEPALSTWEKDIERAIRLDGRTEEQLIFVIDYIYKENGKNSQFWAGNIESGNKLRQHFDKIKNQITAEKHNGKKSISTKIAETEQFLASYQE